MGGEHDDPPELCCDAVPVSGAGVPHVLRDHPPGVGGGVSALELGVVRPALPPGDVHGRQEAVHLLREREAGERAVRLHPQLVPVVPLQVGVSPRVHGAKLRAEHWTGRLHRRGGRGRALFELCGGYGDQHVEDQDGGGYNGEGEGGTRCTNSHGDKVSKLAPQPRGDFVQG